MRFLKVICALAIASGLTPAASAQDTPGVTEVAPGVRHIDGAKVESHQISVAALEQAIANEKLSNVFKMLKGKGIPSVGPAGTTTHMYKIHDTDTQEDKVVILFVLKKKIVDHLIT